MPDPMEGTLAANVHNPAFGPHEYKDPTEGAKDEVKAESGEAPETPQPTETDPTSVEDPEAPAYDTMLKAELEEMVAERQAAGREIEVEGNLKSDYVAALEADDAAED